MKRRRLRLSVGEAQPDDVVVCLGWTIPPLRPESLPATCSDCGAAIQLHPTTPNVARKVCTDCAEVLSQRGEVAGARVTRQQLDFVRLYRWQGGTKQ